MTIAPEKFQELLEEKNSRKPAVAVIKAAECIGCAKCLPACPVDAIVGHRQKLHAVLSHECIGCGLCLEPCPVDCIELIPLPEHRYNAELAEQRYKSRQIRSLKAKAEEESILREQRLQQSNPTENQTRVDYIAAALARVAGKNDSSRK